MHVAIEPDSYPWGDYHRYTFSLGVEAGVDVSLSGNTAATFDVATRRVVVAGDVVAQTETVCDKLECILRTAGLGWQDVEHIVEYLTPRSAESRGSVQRVLTDRLAGASPTVTALCIDRLLRPEAEIEISVAARRPTQAHLHAGRPRKTDQGSLIYLPSLVSSVDADRNLEAHVGDVLSRAHEQLAALGFGWANVAFAMEHVAASGMSPTGETALDAVDEMGPSRPAGARVFTERLVDPRALVQLSLVVSRDPVRVVDELRGGAAMTRPRGLASAVRTGNYVFVSAQDGVSAPDATEVGGIGDQAQIAYRRVLDLLSASGAAVEHLVETVEYLVPEGLAGYSATAELRERLLARPYPAATGTVCSHLGHPRAQFVVYAKAVIPEAAL